MITGTNDASCNMKPWNMKKVAWITNFWLPRARPAGTTGALFLACRESWKSMKTAPKNHYFYSFFSPFCDPKVHLKWHPWAPPLRESGPRGLQKGLPKRPSEMAPGKKPGFQKNRWFRLSETYFFFRRGFPETSPKSTPKTMPSGTTPQHDSSQGRQKCSRGCPIWKARGAAFYCPKMCSETLWIIGFVLAKPTFSTNAVWVLPLKKHLKFDEHVVQIHQKGAQKSSSSRTKSDVQKPRKTIVWLQ